MRPSRRPGFADTRRNFGAKTYWTNVRAGIAGLQVGHKLTLVWIDDMMALTHRQEIEVRSVIEPIKVGYEGRNTRLEGVLLGRSACVLRSGDNEVHEPTHETPLKPFGGRTNPLSSRGHRATLYPE